MTDAIDLSPEAVAKMLEGVTPGPWESRQDEDAAWAILHDGAFVTYAFPTECGAGGDTEANARFIAWAREAVPALASRLAEVEAQLAEWQASQHYRYIGRDGKPVLARDLEARAEAAEAKLAEVEARAEAIIKAYQNRDLPVLTTICVTGVADGKKMKGETE